MTREPDDSFAELVEQGVRAYQHTQRLKLIGMTVAYIAEATAIGVSTLDSWRSRTMRRIPHNFHVLQRFAKVCVAGAPELGQEWVRDLLLAAGMAGYADRALAEIFPEDSSLRKDAHSTTTETAGPPSMSLSSGGWRQEKGSSTSTVPNLPDWYVARMACLDELKGRIKAIHASGGYVPIVGMAGIGKTTLLTAIGRDEEMRALFPNGVCWLTLQAGEDPLALLRRIATALGEPSPESIRAIPEALQTIRARSAGHSVLLLLDNVTTLSQAGLLRELGPGFVVVATTRRTYVGVTLTGAGQYPITLEKMTTEEAGSLVEAIAPVPADQRASVDRVIHLADGHPYALATVAWASLVLGMAWTEVEAAMQSGSARTKLLRLLNAGNYDIRTSLDADWEELDLRTRTSLDALAQLPYFTAYDVPLAQAVWKVSAADALVTLRSLRAMNLMQPAGGSDGSYTLHWLVRDFACHKMQPR